MQREIKLLCLHEIGWCRLIQLEFGKATNHFEELKYVETFCYEFYMFSSGKFLFVVKKFSIW